MKLGYTIIYVQSVPETLAFYDKAFGLKTRFLVDGGSYGELDLPGNGSTTLAFAAETFVEGNIGANQFRFNRKGGESLAAGAEISFVVDKDQGETVETCFETAVAAGAQSVKEPGTKPWGQVVAYVRDCNGFLVEICTPVGG